MNTHILHLFAMPKIMLIKTIKKPFTILQPKRKSRHNLTRIEHQSLSTKMPIWLKSPSVRLCKYLKSTQSRRQIIIKNMRLRKWLQRCKEWMSKQPKRMTEDSKRWKEHRKWKRLSELALIMLTRPQAWPTLTVSITDPIIPQARSTSTRSTVWNDLYYCDRI